MPRPIVPNITYSKHTPNLVAINGHTITIYADYAIYNETTGKFILPEDCKRAL